MDGEAFFDGSPGTDRAGGVGWQVATRGGACFRCQSEPRDQADAALPSHGGCRPQKFGGHKRAALADHEAKVRALVAARPDMTVTELWRELTAQGIKVGRSAVGRFLLQLRLTFKKNAARRRTGAA
jgi:hypothetical protein